MHVKTCNVFVRASVYVFSLFWMEQIFAAQENICDGERALFHCDVARGGDIALCPSYLRGALVGVQYRFVRRGVVELAYPQSSFSFAGFRYNHYFRHMTDYKRVTFSRGAYIYSIYADYSGGESREISKVAGVMVSKSVDIVDANVACVKVHENSLQDLIPHLACDTDDALGCGKLGI